MYIADPVPKRINEINWYVITEDADFGSQYRDLNNLMKKGNITWSDTSASNSSNHPENNKYSYNIPRKYFEKINKPFKFKLGDSVQGNDKGFYYSYPKSAYTDKLFEGEVCKGVSNSSFIINFRECYHGVNWYTDDADSNWYTEDGLQAKSVSTAELSDWAKQIKVGDLVWVKGYFSEDSAGSNPVASTYSNLKVIKLNVLDRADLVQLEDGWNYRLYRDLGPAQITPTDTITSKIQEVLNKGFVKGAKFKDLVHNIEFEIAGPPKEKDFYIKGVIYIPIIVREGINNKTACICRDGKWATLIGTKGGMNLEGLEDIFLNPKLSEDHILHVVKDLKFNEEEFNALPFNQKLELNIKSKN